MANRAELKEVYLLVAFGAEEQGYWGEIFCGIIRFCTIMQIKLIDKTWNIW